jgi:hypothetical protein
MMERSWILFKKIFKEPDWITALGSKYGLIVGLGVAVGSILLLNQLLYSYHSLIQTSLIGFRGTLRIGSSEKMIRSLVKVLSENHKDIPYSLYWDSQRAVKFELIQDGNKKKIQTRVMVLEESYLKEKLKQRDCDLVSESNVSAFGNNLLYTAISGFRVDNEIMSRSDLFQDFILSLPRSKHCRFDTGMMTSYPVLFLTWSTINKDPYRWNNLPNLEFHFQNPDLNAQWEEKLENMLKNARDSILFEHFDISPQELNYAIDNIFEAEELEKADKILNLGKRFSQAVFSIAVIYLILIIFFGVALLKELKKKSFSITMMLGASKSDLLKAFGIRGVFLGVVSSAIGIFGFFLAAYIITYIDVLPINDLLSEWSGDQIVYAIVSPALILLILSLLFAKLFLKKGKIHE